MNQPSAVASSGLIARLGWRAERRPEAGFAHALGAAAAAFAFFATNALVIKVTSDDATGPGVGFNMVLLAVAFVAGAQIAGPVRSACMTAIVLAVPAIWGFAFFGSGQATGGDLRGFYILTILSYAALYLLVWTKGRGIVLGLALLVFVLWIVGEVQGLDRNPVPFQSSFQTQNQVNVGSNGELQVTKSDDKTTATSVTAIVIGLAYLGAGAALDRKKLAGVATPFIVVGALATIAGAVVLGAKESLLGGGIAAVASGAVVGLVGGQGTDRRASTWFGVLFVLGGFVAIVIDVVTGGNLQNSGDALEYAGLFALVAVLLGGAAWYAAPRLREHVDGDINAPTTG
jgi:hypothetical protein